MLNITGKPLRPKFWIILIHPFDKIFKTGTVILYSNDERSPELRLRHIAHPYRIREMFSNLIEEQRALHKVRMSEFQY